MKQFFKIMFASTLGAMMAIGIIIAITIFTSIGILASMDHASSYKPNKNTVFKIKLDGILADNTNDDPLAALIGKEEYNLSLKDLLETIHTAKQNDKIAGIYLESGQILAGSANLGAIRNALIDFKKSGKFVVAYADNFSQGGYYLCSIADKIFLNPQGMLTLTGLSSQTTFYKGLLDKLGVEMQIFKVGTYKGAVEPFMLNKLSDANREQILSYMSHIWSNISHDIAEARGITTDSVNRYANEGLAFADPQKAVDLGFIDELKYKPDVDDFVKNLAGQDKKKLATASISQIKTLRKEINDDTPGIAILYAEGEIKPQMPGDIYGIDQCISGKMAKELIKLKNDDDVKAVVFRVNSPGGSAYISDQIWKQVVELKKVKPIVVSMGDVAASGGYYISCAANKIVAEPNTITGSIGIFGMFPNASGLFDKLSLSTDVVKTNAFADLGDPSRPMTNDEKALIQGFVERGYQTFLTRCAEGRGMTTKEINAIGQGRVWTGEQAKERGLVDELGGIDTAVKIAAQLANLEKYHISSVSNNKNLLDELLEDKLDELKLSVIKNVLGNEYYYFKTLHNIKNNCGIMARMPYDIKPL